MIDIILHGCNGRMGKALRERIAADADFKIAAGIDANLSPAEFPVFANIKECRIPADVIVDFSTALAVPGLLGYAVSEKIPVVVCTTGLDDAAKKLLGAASREIPVFLSANMSLGISLLVNIAKKAALVLSRAGFDIEILESHHNQKIDAPSGTALLIGEAINGALDGEYEFVFDRSGRREKRSDKEIGMHSVRGGTITGEHTVLFAGAGETLELTHRAATRDIFAAGALAAAKFLAGKPAGKYGMEDLIENITALC